MKDIIRNGHAMPTVHTALSITVDTKKPTEHNSKAKKEGMAGIN